MLTLIVGRAGSGKTSRMYGEIASLAAAGVENIVLVVPEQFSHDAERELAERCGDSVSLHAEVLSFSRMENRVFSELGGMAEKTLDKGGRILAMSLAMGDTAHALKTYSGVSRRSDFLQGLLTAYDEMRMARVTPDDLHCAADRVGGTLSDKLEDLSLIFAAYETVKNRTGRDERDRMERLADNVEESSIGSEGKIYIDGFTDFTAQEMRVLRGLMVKGADVTVVLTCGPLDERDAVFELPRRTASQLLAIAGELHAESQIISISGGNLRSQPLRYMERSLFDYSARPYPGGGDDIRLTEAATVSQECSAAAAEVLRFVRAGHRFRDVAVTAADWEKYSGVVRGTFARYGIPVNVTEKDDVLDKPVLAFVTGALDVITGGWSYADMFRYLKTGLADVSAPDLDVLENYVLKWNIRGSSAWNGEREWTMPPAGYTDVLSDEDKALLERLNELRRTVAQPLYGLQQGLKDAAGAIDKTRALYGFLEDIDLPKRLDERQAAFEAAGRLQTADEYGQLWEILVSAMQQFADILGDSDVDTDEFARLFKLVLGQYQVGAIPSNADSVGLGSMRRMRGRGVKLLIVMGAVDGALPAREQSGGVFSDSERDVLKSIGLPIADGTDESVARELNAAYVSLTMPSERLVLSYPSEGGKNRRSFIMTRLERLFSARPETPGDDIYTEAQDPCFEAAAAGEGAYSAAARSYFESRPDTAPRLRAILASAREMTGRLSRPAAEALYGKKISVTATRMEKFSSCRYAYFLQYGLQARKRSRAELDAPQTGTFMHYVLEGVVRAAQERGGFAKLSDDEVAELARRFVKEYAERYLGGFEDKSGRFRYLYSRLADDAVRVSVTMADELRSSDFRPLDFELRFAGNGDLPPVETEGVKVSGIVDRVDGWVKDDKLYLRVVDYKTGKKAFSLSDIWYGMGVQMLMYLFALEREGGDRYGKQIVPAGVLYAPARDVILSVQSDPDDVTLESERAKLSKRSGLILNDEEVISAMSRKPEKYLPVTIDKKKGNVTRGSLADAEQLGMLSRHIDGLLKTMGREISDGSITADPFYKNQNENACLWCDYYDACHFADSADSSSRLRYQRTLKSDEVWQKLGEETV